VPQPQHHDGDPGGEGRDDDGDHDDDKRAGQLGDRRGACGGPPL
jgi:hypothetical protein